MTARAGQPWAWLSCAIVLERNYNGRGVVHLNPFAPEERWQVVSDLYDVWFWPMPMAVTHFPTKEPKR